MTREDQLQVEKTCRRIAHDAIRDQVALSEWRLKYEQRDLLPDELSTVQALRERGMYPLGGEPRTDAVRPFLSSDDDIGEFAPSDTERLDKLEAHLIKKHWTGVLIFDECVASHGGTQSLREAIDKLGE